MTDAQYLAHFHAAVTGAFVCGLQHPIEWIANYNRHYDLYPQESIPAIVSASAKMLVEFYEIDHLRKPTTAEEVIEWANGHYPKGHLCHGFFEGWEREITPHIPDLNPIETAPCDTAVKG